MASVNSLTSSTSAAPLVHVSAAADGNESVSAAAGAIRKEDSAQAKAHEAAQKVFNTDVIMAHLFPFYGNPCLFQVNKCCASVIFNTLHPRAVAIPNSLSILLPNLHAHPIVGAYVRRLGVNNLNDHTEGPQKPVFTRYRELCHAMSQDSTELDLSPSDNDSLVDLAQNIKDGSFMKIWSKIRDKLPQALPPFGTTNDMRKWLQNNPELCAKVTELGLRNCKLPIIPDEIRFFPSLVSLDLGENKILYVPENAFQGLPQLHRIFLDRNQITNLPSQLFANLPNLETLCLAGNLLTALPEELFNSLGNLGKLWLDGNFLRDLPANLFARLVPPNALSPPKLRDLWLNVNQIAAFPIGFFEPLRHNLRRLGIADNPVQGDLFPLDLLANLTFIQLSPSQFQDQRAHIQVAYPNLTVQNL